VPAFALVEYRDENGDIAQTVEALLAQDTLVRAGLPCGDGEHYFITVAGPAKAERIQAFRLAEHDCFGDLDLLLGLAEALELDLDELEYTVPRNKVDLQDQPQAEILAPKKAGK